MKRWLTTSRQSYMLYFVAPWLVRSAALEEYRFVSKRIFVGNLAFATTNDGLRAHFEAQGLVVTSAQVITDRETGRSRGFAFVELGEESDLQTAIERSNDRELDGRRLAVREAHDRKAGGGEGTRRSSRPPVGFPRPSRPRSAGSEGDDVGERSGRGRGRGGPREREAGQGERKQFSKPDAPPGGGRKRRKEKRRGEGGGRRDEWGEKRQKKYRGGRGWDDYEDYD